MTVGLIRENVGYCAPVSLWSWDSDSSDLNTTGSNENVYL